MGDDIVNTTIRCLECDELFEGQTNYRFCPTCDALFNLQNRGKRNCSLCFDWLPLDEEHFAKRDGKFIAWCRECAEKKKTQKNDF